ncbi:hypothetical protein MLD38_022624 [Melastoma candidum]|uniref:Uncharacterized protein n=1 Tax=Melastoma candidum TaxID=119954 RepID=A0ACB9QKG0_9MYRT|nr:hypothetical protein MLD38_022624 [Melastoma candidum]
MLVDGDGDDPSAAHPLGEHDQVADRNLHALIGSVRGTLTLLPLSRRAAYINYMDLDLGVMEVTTSIKDKGEDAVKIGQAWGRSTSWGTTRGWRELKPSLILKTSSEIDRGSLQHHKDLVHETEN